MKLLVQNFRLKLAIWIDRLLMHITNPINIEDPEPHNKYYNAGGIHIVGHNLEQNRPKRAKTKQTLPITRKIEETLTEFPTAISTYILHPTIYLSSSNITHNMDTACETTQHEPTRHALKQCKLRPKTAYQQKIIRHKTKNK
jgi:hypothetical protein